MPAPVPLFFVVGVGKSRWEMPIYLAVLTKIRFLGLPVAIELWLFEKDGFPKRKLTMLLRKRGTKAQWREFWGTASGRWGEQADDGRAVKGHLFCSAKARDVAA